MARGIPFIKGQWWGAFVFFLHVSMNELLNKRLLARILKLKPKHSPSYLYMNLTWIFTCGLESFIYHTASNSIQPQSTPTAWYYTAPLAQFLWSTNKRLWFVVTVNVFFCTPSYADISVVHLWLVLSWPSWAGIKAIAKIFIFKIFNIFTIFMIHVEYHW